MSVHVMAPARILHVQIASRELRLCRVVAQSDPDISANTLVVRSSNGEVDTVVNPSAGVANRNVIGNSNEVNSTGAMYCMLPARCDEIHDEPQRTFGGERYCVEATIRGRERHALIPTPHQTIQPG